MDVPVGASTVASKVNITVSIPNGTVIPVQSIVSPPDKTPPPDILVIPLYPPGTTSCTDTPVAVTAPSLLINIVKVTISPTFGVVSLTIFSIDKSEVCGVIIKLSSSSSLWSPSSLSGVLSGSC